jgi:hypothetical protein
VTDDLDRPEEDGYDLLVPFVACQSQGGPYDDEAFVAGFQCGEVDKALTVGAVSNATTVRFPMARTVLLKQIELLAMNRGYPVMNVTESEEYPEWCDLTLTRGES